MSSPFEESMVFVLRRRVDRAEALSAELLVALNNHHQVCIEHEESYPGSELCLMTERAIAKATA